MSFCKELAPYLNAGKKNSDIVLENLGFKINLFDMDHYNEYLKESSWMAEDGYCQYENCRLPVGT